MDDAFGGLCLGNLIPELNSQYPNQDVYVKVEPYGVPQFHFTEDGTANISSKGRLTVYTNLHADPVLFIGAALKAEVKPVIRNRRLYGNLTITSLKFVVHRTALSAESMKSIEVLGPATKVILEPELRKLMQNGLDLPKLELFDLIDPVLQVHDGYAQVQTGFRIDSRKAGQLIANALQQGVQNMS